jgi:aldose 1-epimerase
MFRKSLRYDLLGLCMLMMAASSFNLNAATAASGREFAGQESAGLNVHKELFGKLADGTAIDKYTLTNENGMSVGVITYGAIIQSVMVADKDGKIEDVALGFDSLDSYTNPAYINNCPYFGATIGRYGNRIAKGQFTLDGAQYQIPVNNGPNALHGGVKGFDKEVWSATPIEGPTWVGVELNYFSPEGQMGFPGDLAVTVRYTLDNDNDLRIHYSAISNKDTVINLTNHTYFNLAGAGSGTVLDQVAMINANRFTPVDKTLIPTGELQNVQGTPFDFLKPTAIGTRIHDDNVQLKNAEPKQGGYDMNWVLNNPGNLSALAVRVTDPVSGRALEMYTTEPGVQFYTGNFLDGTLKGNGGSYDHWGAFTLEAQHFPDSPNHSNFPSTELKAGRKYTQTTVYKFLPL